MDKLNFSNNLSTTLSAGCTDVATSIEVESAAGVVAGSLNEMRLTITDGTNIEVVTCTSLSGTTLTVVRGQEGTSGRAWSAGATVENRLTAETAERFLQTLPDGSTDTSGTGITIQKDRTSDDQVASGAEAIAIGPNSKASATAAIAIGDDSEATGIGSVALSGAKVPYRRSLGFDQFLSYAPTRSDRPDCISLGQSNKSHPFAGSFSSPAVPFVGEHEYWYLGGADESETRVQNASEVVYYSIPFQAGDQTWQASTSYEHGQSVRPTTPNGYVYTAYIWPNDVKTTDTSGGTEPTWPTTAGNSVFDGDIEWICVDPTDIGFLMPDYARFTPTSVGVLVKTYGTSGSVTQPSFSFGISGDLDKWLAATQSTKLTGNLSNQFWEPTNTEGAKEFGASLTTAGMNVDISAIFVVKGIVMEVLSA